MAKKTSNPVVTTPKKTKKASITAVGPNAETGHVATNSVKTPKKKGTSKEGKRLTRLLLVKQVREIVLSCWLKIFLR